MKQAVDTIVAVCNLLASDAIAAAGSLISESPSSDTASPPLRNAAKYPLSGDPPTKRRYTSRQATAVFVRDGFIDRYSGDRLVFPGVLRIISHFLPVDFPYHPNWKYGVGHEWYWDLYATVDHLVPVAGQGADDVTNWVTTSMRRNLLKSNRALSDLGWSVFAPGDTAMWDGQMSWYVDFIASRPDLQRIASLRGWERAAIAASVP